MIKSILLIEDNEVDQMLFQEYMRDTRIENWDLTVKSTLKEGLEIIRNKVCDIVVLDLSLPDSSDLEGLNRVREVDQFLPVIILTGLGESEVGKKSIKEGAQDYLMKDGLTGRLLEKSTEYALERALLNKHDQQDTIDQLRRAEKELLKQQIELRDSLERERALNALRSRFIAGASHQFRSPLSVIKSNTQLLLSLSQPDEKLERISERINREMERLFILMDDLYKVNALASSETLANKTQINLMKAVDRILNEDSIRESFTKTIDQIEVRGEPQALQMDESHFSESLKCLLISIARFQVESRSPEISIDFQVEDVHLSIRNTGFFVSDAEMEQLFTPFFHPNNQPDYAGSALSLFKASKYAELNGGSLSAGCAETKEVSFSMSFPLI